MTSQNCCPAELTNSEIEEKHRETLLRNELVSGAIEIAERILSSSVYVRFQKGEQIIRQADTDDCVYFLLAGKVEVRIDGRHIDHKSVPYTVGELAAKKAGSPRTASVIVDSEELEALVVSGTVFRKLMQDYPSFNANLEAAVDTMNRVKIAQLGKAKNDSGLPWSAVSAASATITAFAAGVLAWSAELTTLQIAASAVGVGMVSFMVLLLLNPEYIYRNTFRFSGLAAIALAVYGGISWSFTFDGTERPIPFLLDFSVGEERKGAALVIALVALLILAWLSAHYDSKLRGGK